MNNKVLRLTFLAAIFALMAIFTYSPLSTIVISAYTITVLHIFVLIGIFVFDDWKETLYLGLFFGLITMIYSIQFPGAIGQNVPFQNPLVSVVPRVAFAFVAFGLIQMLKQFKNNVIAIGIWAFVATAIHTTLVLGAISVVVTMLPREVIQTVVTLNAIPEAILAAVVVPLVAIPLTKYINKNK